MWDEEIFQIDKIFDQDEEDDEEHNHQALLKLKGRIH